jgi:bifunctional DNase/RNase
VDTKVKLRVKGITGSQPELGVYTLILTEEDGQLYIPIIVGLTEAQSIAVFIEKVIPPRPMTHDLIYTMMRSCNIHLLEVYIYKYDDGIFFAELLIENNEKLIHVDARTSDAIAIAMRARCDIYAHSDVMDECGIDEDEMSFTEVDIDMDDEERKGGAKGDNDTEGDGSDDTPQPIDLRAAEEARVEKMALKLGLNDLHLRLDKAVQVENYEHARIYRDEIIRRENIRNKKKNG